MTTETETTFLLIIFGNSKWNVTVLGIGATGRVFLLSVCSTSESGAGIAGTVVVDLDGLWTFIPKQNDFCSI